MKKALVLLVGLSMLLVLSVGYAFSQHNPVTEVFPLVPQHPDAEAGEMTDETPQLWFVELSGAPVVEGGKPKSIGAEKENFRNQAQKAKIKYEERFAYETLWNGISIAITPGELNKLSRLGNIKALYPVVTIAQPEVTPESGKDLASALAMTGADTVQSELGYTGKGIKVGVIDTGIDYKHPDLGGGFGPGHRVFTGWDFVGEDYNADSSSPGYNPVPDPDDDPMDFAGHGTHVAGIIGANGQVTGVAPDVTFGAYKVFGTEGSTTSDIMLAALEMALADGVDVVNMSIGASYQWPNYPTAQASDRLVNKGIVVVASIGNSGANGIYSAGAPGVGKKVIGVASFDNTHTLLNTFTISPDATSIGYNPATAAPAPPVSGTYPMAPADLLGQPLEPGGLEGKIALVPRGTYSFYEKALNAQNAGAIGVVLYNNVAGRINPTVEGEETITIPVVAISDTEGLLIRSRLESGPVELTWTDEQGSFVSPTGGLISSFSSYGLAPDLSLKPDIGAPGGGIYSTYPLALGGYATLGGTSMSSPHVAGAAALFLEAHPKTPAQAVGRILQNSSIPQNWWGNPGLGYLDNVHRQGAGMLAIDKAILATGRIEPGKLALGESENGPATHTLTIENKGKSPVTYTLSHEGALSTGPDTFTPAFYLGFAGVSFSQQELIVPAKGSASIDVTITANPGLPEGSLYGGYLVFTGSDGSVLRVPYAGYKGDYQAKPVLTPTQYGFPWLARVVGDSYFLEDEGAVYTLSGDDPYFLFHCDHASQLLKAEIYDANTGRAWGKAIELNYFYRNSTPTGFFAISWDGLTMRGNKQIEVPDGEYVLKISVLKALGDSDNPEHWETWTSPMFVIQRP